MAEDADARGGAHPAPTPDGDAPAETELLRARAESRLRTMQHAGAHQPPSGRSIAATAHELAVHRVELDMQRDELLRTRDELDESAERYAHLYDFAPAGMLSLDPAGELTRANLAAARLLRRERALLVGRRLAEFVAPDDQDEFERFLDAVGSSSAPNVCEIDLAVPATAPVSVIVDARRPPSGSGWELAMVDTSEMRAAQREIGELARVAAREEIGRQLHDTVLQRLFGVSSSLQALMLRGRFDAAEQEVLQRMVDELSTTVLEIWQTVFEQQP